MSVVFARIDSQVQAYFAPWTDMPSHSLMVTGAQQALYAIQEKLRADDIARVLAGKRPRYIELVRWIDDEVTAMLDADKARIEAKAARR